MEMPWFVENTLAIGYEIDPFRVTVNAGGTNALRDCNLEGEALEGYNGSGYVDMRPDAIPRDLGSLGREWGCPQKATIRP
jgi:hypothetical protein